MAPLSHHHARSILGARRRVPLPAVRLRAGGGVEPLLPEERELLLRVHAVEGGHLRHAAHQRPRRPQPAVLRGHAVLSEAAAALSEVLANAGLELGVQDDQLVLAGRL